MLKLSKILLAPILLWQGKRVRASIIKLPEPAGDRAGHQGHGKPLRLLILGDSAGAGVGVDEQGLGLSGQLVNCLSNHFTVQWQLVARTGESTCSVLELLQHLTPQPFDVIVTSLGVNDVTSGKSGKQFYRDLQSLHLQLMQRYTPQHIIFSGMPPMGEFPALPNPLRWYLGERAARFDRVMHQFAHHNHCQYYALPSMMDSQEMASDGFHPGPQVYTQWGKGLAEHIIELCY
ncbi:SGNH/GDSL hydrolase family protein [Aliiglaciecola litoralis]|uniref:SGNH/GDSL hydrolase family protein n=1 Tax=Aliiglaciecola litoralis TaxID=582857 RepID=A0ABP3X674_9ALTE